ncbi:MAG: gamma-glutamyltransferase family protein [Thermomicrobiales bacterium]
MAIASSRTRAGVTVGFPVPGAGANDPWIRRRTFPTYATKGMIAAAHPLTVEAGLHILRRGGNAIDAAVGAGLMAAVVMPEMCGLGGDLFAVVHMPGHDPIAVQGSGISPRNASIEHMRTHGDNDGRTMPYQGPLSISVPGMVDAYFRLLERFGTMAFAEVAAPAIATARDGFPLLPNGAGAIAENIELLARDEAAAAIFLPRGHPLATGERLVQSDLADTLETLARDGRDSFYTGDIGKRITDYLAAVGGKLDMDDFAGHETDFTDPIATTYRDHTVHQTAIPSQGLILLESLNIVENADFGADLTAEVIHTQVEAKKLAYADRLAYAADPKFHDTPLDMLLSKPWAAERYAQIDPAHAATDVPAGTFSPGDTTYLCVADGNGGMISLIQSVSAAFGSCVVGGDTGVVLNNRVGRGFSLEEGHPNIYAPGKKTMHTLNCFSIAAPDGTPVLVGGTPGGDGQPQWNMQMVSALLDRSLDVQAAIEQPRWTSLPGTDPDGVHQPFTLAVEDRFGEEILAALAAKGHTLVARGAWGGGGSAQMIARDPETGILIGGTDTRVEGTVLGFS